MNETSHHSAEAVAGKAVSETSDRVVLYERRGHVAVLTLNRPDSLNALNYAVFDRLREAWSVIDADPQVRVTIVTGAGRGFCAGADMVGRAERDGTADDERSGRRPLPTFTARQCKVYKPVIVAVNGVCAGAGMHFVVDCEVVLAASSATFTDTHVNVGQITALEPIGLSRKIPLGAVLRMVCMGRSERVTAQRGYELGLVSQVVDDADLMDTAMALAEQIAVASPDTLRKSLQAIWESLDTGLDEALDRGWDLIQDHYVHPDSVEGPLAFTEKRDPTWTIEVRPPSPSVD
jgi:enoyl-CoA hydratase/carnithine racemase